MNQPNDGHFTSNFLTPEGIYPVLVILCKLLSNFTAAVSRTEISSFNITINLLEAGKKAKVLEADKGKTSHWGCYHNRITSVPQIQCTA